MASDPGYFVVRAEALGRDLAVATTSDGKARARAERPDLDAWSWPELKRLDEAEATADEIRAVDLVKRALGGRVIDPSKIPSDHYVRRSVARQDGGARLVDVLVHVVHDVVVERHGVFAIPRDFMQHVALVREKILLMGRR